MMTAPLSADRALAALRAAGLPVRGLIVPDVADPATWRFEGVSPAETDRARAIVEQLLAPTPAPPASAFWPAAPTALEQDVQRIKAHIGLR